MFTSVQITAIVMLLQAFGVGQATIDEVKLDLTRQASASQPTATADNTVTQNSTQPDPILGAVTPCVDSPVFSLTPTVKDVNGNVVPQTNAVLHVPYHGVVWFFNSSVSSSCTGKQLPYGQWTAARHITQSPDIRSGRTVYDFGETNNNGTQDVLPDTITVSAMGSTTSFELELEPSL